VVANAPKDPPPKKQRRRLQTEQRLIDAVGVVLSEQGFLQLGVNAVAEQADVSKALIYRYFGDFESLVRVYAQSGQFWPSLDEVLGEDRHVLEGDDPAVIGARVLDRYGAALRRRPSTLSLLGWECVARTPLAGILETVRVDFEEALFGELARAGVPLPPAVMGSAAIFAAAINYLSLRGRFIRDFGVFKIDSEAGWQQIGWIFEQVFRALMTAEDLQMAPPAADR
jgi:AcrR family transcriptional regulator